MTYKRLTKWSDVGTLHIFDFCGQEVPLSEATALDIDQIAGRLADLEDKIEDGKLIENSWWDHIQEEFGRYFSKNQELRMKIAELKEIISHEHTKQMEWFAMAGKYKTENMTLKNKLKKYEGRQ